MTPPRPAASQVTETAAVRFCRQAVLVLLGCAMAGLPVLFSIQTYDQFELPKVVAMRCLTAAMLALWALRLALQGRLEWRRTPLDLPVLAWTLWLLVKTLHSVSPFISWRGEYENFAGSLTQANYALLFFIATQHVRRRQQAEAMTFAFLAGGVAAALYALCQALGLDFIGWASTSVIQRRFFSSLGNPNFLGGLMVMTLPLAAVFFLTDQGRVRLWLTVSIQAAALAGWLGLYFFFPPGHSLDPAAIRASETSVLWVAGAYFLLLLAQGFLLIKGKLAASKFVMSAGLFQVLFASLLFTGCRGAYLGFLAFPAVLSVCPPTRKFVRLTAIVLAGLIGLSFVLGPELSRRMVDSFRHPFEAADKSRLQIWAPALKVWKAHPLTGTGVDTFKTVFPRFSSSKFSDYDGANVSSRTAHCEPLQILATLGSVGLILWLWLLATWALAWWRRVKGEGHGSHGYWLAGLGAAAAAYLVQNLVSFGVTSISAPFWMLLALLWADEAKEVAGAFPGKTSLPMPARGALASLAAAMMFFGLPAAFSTYAADREYNQGHILSGQAQAMEGISLEEARAYAGYCLDQISARMPLSDPLPGEEAQALLETLRAAENYRQQDPGRPELRGAYASAARRLLNLFAAIRQQKAVDLCPTEVKYHVYLGLAQEELFKFGRPSSRSEAWYKAAEKSYQRSVVLNPWNAYYWGNLGRLNGLKVETGGLEYLAEAEKNYRRAISQAPVTLLFYQNLMQLEALAGRPEDVSALAEGAGGGDLRFAGSVEWTAGKTLWQVSQKLAGQNRTLSLLYRAEALKCLEKAAVLKPEDAAITASLAAVKSLGP